MYSDPFVTFVESRRVLEVYYIGSAKIHIMSSLVPADIIKTLLPGLIAFTSILVVVIVFLLDKYLDVKNIPGKYGSYFYSIIIMSCALGLSGIASLLSLFYLLGMLCDSLYYFILASFIIDILIIVVGTIIMSLFIIFRK